MYKFAKNSGFTLIETLLVVGIFSLLLGISTLLISSSLSTTNSNAAETNIVSDLRMQQLKAMLGVDDSAHGIYFGSGEYVLFTGSSYNAADSSNVVITLVDELSIVNTLPSNQVVFDKVSGEPTNINAAADRITVSSSIGAADQVIEINPIGVVFEL